MEDRSKSKNIAVFTINDLFRSGNLGYNTKLISIKFRLL